MRIGPMFKWFGSKWQSAKRYPKPIHDTIIEPYAGGCGYSLNYCDRQVILWDADPNLSRLWPWLIRECTEALVRDIPVGLPVGTDIRTIGLTIGQQLLLKHWQRTNNVGDCWTVSPWGDKPGQWTENCRARVAEEHTAIRHWKFERPTHLENATWFIDPPYIYNYRYRADLEAFDFDKLGRFVKRIESKCQVIVCEAKCKTTGRIPSYLPFVESHSSVTSRRKSTQSHHSSEVIYAP